jgi:predicted enzyme involved in methoxymalonyl-ACP biosynthesis
MFIGWIKRAYRKVRRKLIYSNKLWYMGAMPYSVKSIPIFTDTINDLAVHISKTEKKY